MNTYTIDQSKKWDYENGFYLTCETGRIGKMMNHYELYKKIAEVDGDVLEFGVFKATSFVRLLAFRDLMESSERRKVIGFDAFGKFPNDLALESDKEFVEKFEGAGGFGISESDLRAQLSTKKVSNYDLVAGDIMQALPDFVQKNPDLKIALLHIDVDVYEPSKLILELLWDKMSSGAILMLDDYNTVEGETKAVNEFFEGKNIPVHGMPFYHIPSFAVKP